MTRREFPAKVKAQAALRASGHCEAAMIPHVLDPCRAKLSTGNIFYEHIICDGIDGEPVLENCAVLCKSCWRIKTRKYDQPIVAETKRQSRRHLGIKKKAKGRPLPGTKASGLKKRMDGTVERRRSAMSSAQGQ